MAGIPRSLKVRKNMVAAHPGSNHRPRCRRCHCDELAVHVHSLDTHAPSSIKGAPHVHLLQIHCHIQLPRSYRLHGWHRLATVADRIHRNRPVLGRDYEPRSIDNGRTFPNWRNLQLHGHHGRRNFRDQVRSNYGDLWLGTSPDCLLGRST